jgi:hypothetical protein
LEDEAFARALALAEEQEAAQSNPSMRNWLPNVFQTEERRPRQPSMQVLEPSDDKTRESNLLKLKEKWTSMSEGLMI